ncbi:diguanylate cyclase (GGDEF) domain-containing protein [Pseudorhodobacter antarcticus]|jgi:diguanylate cyclase (GGDEF)-like protein|uniref:Diguanylate cyclase (GGDEF) domain-containing protein n=2 Tax=Pseudorhodobacter antarcticus TaxID=1077947 RepID=A0A1H8N104_9RHOB|nr:diguanylate cyclase [Pseudorhodobacter antarcticus]SEO23158.1 diguanylate cyclase (GGDEF) domain-containing protein [Pseudorhodobacter antarcticus]
MGQSDMMIAAAAVNGLMPMHVWAMPDGRIRSVGTTLRKAFGPNLLDGTAFFDVFEVRRPGAIFTVDDLRRRAGERLSIVPHRVANVQSLRGIAVALGGEGGVLVNLSFGIGVIEAVVAHHLTDADFAATDLAMELLYLVEAKTAVTEELRQLNLRLQGARDAAQEQALTDTLTGLRNRRALDFAMANLIEHHIPFGLMHIDLDYFKAVNDTLGHAAGDHVLRQVAQSLLLETRSGDTVARVGGDEFVILFNGLTEPESLSRIANRVVERLSEPSDFQGEVCRISASIGITISTDYLPPEAEQMLSDADTALYASKNAGRGQAQLFRGDRRAAGE